MTTVWDRACEFLMAKERFFAGVAGDEPGLLDSALESGARGSAFRDQRAASFAAAGASRMMDVPAVLCSHSGPDLLNALVGIAEARSARIGLVVVTVVVPYPEMGRGGFQEFPVETLGPGLFGWTHRAVDESDFYWALARADVHAHSGFPAHVIVTAAIGAAAATSAPPSAGRIPEFLGASESVIDDVAGAMRNALRPMVILGGGCRGTNPGPVTGIIEATGAACLVTASGRGAFPEGHPRFGGVVGLYLEAGVAAALRASDMLLVVGSQLEETARTGWSPAADALVMHVDVDPSVPGRAIPARPIIADAARFLAALAVAVASSETAVSRDDRWWCPPPRYPVDDGGPLTAPVFWSCLSGVLPNMRFDVIAQENGLADLWGYYYPAFSLPDGMATLVPGEQTALGFGLGSGLGAALAGHRVLAVGGDGAFGMNLSVVATAIERKADIAFIELVDGGFGWPSMSRSAGHPAVNFTVGSGAAAIGASAGIPTWSATEPADVPNALSRVAMTSGPRLLTVVLAERVPFPPH